MPRSWVWFPIYELLNLAGRKVLFFNDILRCLPCSTILKEVSQWKKIKKERTRRKTVYGSEQFTIANTRMIYPPPPSCENLLLSIVEVAAFYWWVKRGLSLSFSYYEMYQLPQEFWMKREKCFFGTCDLWSKWMTLLMKTTWWTLTRQGRRQQLKLRKQKNEPLPPHPAISIIHTFRSFSCCCKGGEAHRSNVALVSAVGTSGHPIQRHPWFSM